MATINYMTEEGLDQLKIEIQTLKTKGRAEMAQMIKEAREKGDLSENAEYDAAKEAQGLLELKISQLEEILANARVMDTAKIDTSKVSVLTTVRVFHMGLKKEIEYTLVTEKEADLKQNKISVSSPIGKGLLGRKVGEEVEIQVPAGKLGMKILDIRI
ncbi:MAG: transcription elongation factor GreA [Chitinophagales bacterium]|nr:transcription elongation factor GreA [Chitinophagales bacterium]HAE13567.1 transcription elongation factor GreA [Bacteroidota bacterium]MCB9019032.1 transcription elongation factor GreA [Chitinophagales bacterium]MCB9022435.1 transcription elongation factor GreA [Chitinophagales bacterium]HPE97437.1 transcription elongation factor GreA [Chitinophagales bacterium]